MAAYQVGRTLALKERQLGIARDQQVHHLLAVPTSLHCTYRNNDVALVEAFSFQLDDGYFVSLGLGHENGLLYEESVAGLHAGVLFIVIFGIRRVFGAPRELLFLSIQGTRPQVLLLHVVTSDSSRHDGISVTLVNELK